MKTLRLIIFLVVALMQLSVPASIVWTRGQTLKRGRLWKFKTAPVDPVDAVRGRYIALRFAAEEYPENPQNYGPGPIPGGSVVYVSLKEDADGFAQVDHVSLTPQKGDNVVKAEAGYARGQKEHVRFPFERLWVTEKVAPEAERAYLANNRRDKQNAYVTVRVCDGDAGLEQLYIDGQPLAEYLRVHPAP